MQKTISCNIGYHTGGLGQHFSQVVEEARAAGNLLHYFSSKIKPGDEAISDMIRQKLAPWLMKWTPVRYSPGYRWHYDCHLFDKIVAGRLRQPVDCFTAFTGAALHSFRKARQLGARRLELIAGNSHVNNCMRLHNEAIKRHPLETSWLNNTQRKKVLLEYEMADTIYVASEYSRQVFINEGIPSSRIGRIHYTVDARHVPNRAAKPDDGVFRVVYVGQVSVFKGVPLLIEAFSRLRGFPAELTLVGGTSTKGMRRYMDQCLAADPRIKMSPGDPLPHLHRADVCVHPSWEDGLAYAPLEALGAGVPVILTQDTGAKEFIREGENGFITPTGDVDALHDRMLQLAGRR